MTDHCLRSRHYVNVIVAGKQVALTYLTMEEAIAHCTRGLGILLVGRLRATVHPMSCWPVPVTPRRWRPFAAAALLREHLPELRRTRDQCRRPDAARAERPNTPTVLSDRDFDALFTTDKPVIFAYHGYPSLIHRLTYRRHGPRQPPRPRLQGGKALAATTPFDTVMMNDLDRFTLVMDDVSTGSSLSAPGPRPCASRWPMPGWLLARTSGNMGRYYLAITDWTWPDRGALNHDRGRR